MIVGGDAHIAPSEKSKIISTVYIIFQRADVGIGPYKCLFDMLPVTLGDSLRVTVFVRILRQLRNANYDLRITRYWLPRVGSPAPTRFGFGHFPGGALWENGEILSILLLLFFPLSYIMYCV